MSATQFGARLRELRVAAGLTQQQLADKAGVSQRGLAQWETGRRKEPGWNQIQALADALGVSCEAFRQPPASLPAPGPGRPPKEKDEAEEAQPKRPRGRPRKEIGQTADAEPKRHRGRPRKGE